MTQQQLNQIQSKYPKFGTDNNSKIIDLVDLEIKKAKNQITQAIWDILEAHYNPKIDPAEPTDRHSELMQAIREAKINMLIKNQKIDLQEAKRIEANFEDIPNDHLQALLQPHIQRQDKPEINQFLNQNE